MKKTNLSLIVLAVLTMFSSSVFALEAPTVLSVSPGPFGIYFDWDDVTGAAKYSVDVEGLVSYMYFDDGPQWGLAYVEISMGTSDYNYYMENSNLWISKRNIAGLLAEEIDVEGPILVLGLLGEAKVKALDPGKEKGRQNNPFLDPPVGFFTMINRWVFD